MLVNFSGKPSTAHPTRKPPTSAPDSRKVVKLLGGCPSHSMGRSIWGVVWWGPSLRRFWGEGGTNGTQGVQVQGVGPHGKVCFYYLRWGFQQTTFNFFTEVRGLRYPLNSNKNMIVFSVEFSKKPQYNCIKKETIRVGILQSWQLPPIHIWYSTRRFLFYMVGTKDTCCLNNFLNVITSVKNPKTKNNNSFLFLLVLFFSFSCFGKHILFLVLLTWCFFWV